MTKKKYDIIIKQLPIDEGLTVTDLTNIIKQLNTNLEFLTIDTGLFDLPMMLEQNSCYTIFIPVTLADLFDYKVNDIIAFISTKYDFQGSSQEFNLITDTGQKYSVLVE